MAHVLPFAEVLEAADHLSQDEQEELIAILHRRLKRLASGWQPRSTKLAKSLRKAVVCLRPLTN